MSAQDPFYLVKDEIQDLVNKVHSSYSRWEAIPPGSADRDRLTRELTSGAESVDWQVEELEKAITVAARDPSRFNVDAAEIDKRRKWTSQTRNQMANIKRALQAAAAAAPARDRKELLRMQDKAVKMGKLDKAAMKDNDDFIGNEGDRQALIMREQDNELDSLGEHVQRIGEIGLVIHDELGQQEKILEDLDKDMDNVAGRLDFVQRKMTNLINKAGMRGQICLLVFLLVLLLVLIILVFET